MYPYNYSFIHIIYSNLPRKVFSSRKLSHGTVWPRAPKGGNQGGNRGPEPTHSAPTKEGAKAGSKGQSQRTEKLGSRSHQNPFGGLNIRLEGFNRARDLKAPMSEGPNVYIYICIYMYIYIYICEFKYIYVYK